MAGRGHPSRAEASPIAASENTPTISVDETLRIFRVMAPQGLQIDLGPKWCTMIVNKDQ